MHPENDEADQQHSREPDIAGRRRFVELQEALEDAQQRAGATRIHQPVLDFLYARTGCKSLARPEWERQVRIATAFDENLTRFGSPLLLKRISNRIGDTLRTAVVHEMMSAPTLAIGYHGGFSIPRRKLFARLFPGSVVIGASGKHAAHDGAFALFAAREALLENRPVLMAPDGRFGKEADVISVLGAQLPVTDGAPFLAHATGCKVTWFALVWTGSDFTIETCSGPQREGGEAFVQYRKRFYRFYTERLEGVFTGDPANLPLSQNWRLIFGAMLAGKVYRYRRPTR